MPISRHSSHPTPRATDTPVVAVPIDPTGQLIATVLGHLLIATGLVVAGFWLAAVSITCGVAR